MVKVSDLMSNILSSLIPNAVRNIFIQKPLLSLCEINVSRRRFTVNSYPRLKCAQNPMASIGVPQTSTGTYPIAHSNIWQYYMWSLLVNRAPDLFILESFSTVDPMITYLNTKEQHLSGIGFTSRRSFLSLRHNLGHYISPRQNSGKPFPLNFHLAR